MVLIAILLPLLVYTYAAVTIPGTTLQRPNEWFAAFKSIGTTPFSNSAIAYAFQVASIYPFMMWGSQGLLLIPLLNSLFWGLGIVSFALVLPRLQSFISKDHTVHGYLGDTYGSRLRPWSSLVTVAGLLGLAIGEVVWGSAVLKPMLPNGDLIYAVMFLFLFAALAYVSYGGQASSIRTDQVQLLFSYVGLAGVFVFLAYIAAFHGSPQSAPLQVIALVTLVLAVWVLALRRGRFIDTSDSVTSYGRGMTAIGNVVVSGGLLLMVLGLVIVIGRQDWHHAFRGMPSQLTGFGYPGVIAICLLPLLWQFVDMTNWQRLLCLRSDESDSNQSEHLKEMQKGFRIYAVESPWTWIAFVALGALAAVAMPESVQNGSFVALPGMLARSVRVIDQVMAYLFVGSVTAIMLSTVDSVISAAMFVFVYDTWKPTRQRLDDTQTSAESGMQGLLATARLFGLVALLALLAVFVFIDVKHKGGEQFISLLFAFYSAQLSLAPVVFGAIFVPRAWIPSQAFAMSSIGVGAVAGVALGVYSLFYAPSLSWWPIPVSLVLSSIIFVLGMGARIIQSGRAPSGRTV